MSLSWSDAPGIAKALLAAYPEKDRLALSREELCGLVRALPCFSDASQPSPRVLSSILWTWMRFADEGPGAQTSGG